MDERLVIEVIGAIFIAFFAGAGAIFTANVARSKAPVENAETISRAAISLVAPLQEKIHTVELEMEELKVYFDGLIREGEAQILQLQAENNLLLRWNNALIHQVISYGGQPITLAEVKGRINFDVDNGDPDYPKAGVE